MKTVIVGGVAGGASAAARLRRLDERAQIVIFEKTGYISYANCGLPYYVGGKISDRESLTLQTPESFARRFNVDVRVNCLVESIDRALKTVTVRNLKTGEIFTERYDKLILSPGAKPVVPDFCRGGDRVYTLRTVEDALALKEACRSGIATAAVRGGGFMGLETAENLTRAGLKVSLFERGGHVLATVDDEIAARIHAELAANGIKLFTDADTRRLGTIGDKAELELSDGTVMTFDMAVVAIGVTPDSSLAAAAGLQTGTKGAIRVDTHMRTSDADIYAVGDAVEVISLPYGAPASIALAGPANKQGRIAADNIAGIDSEYTGTQGTSVIKIFGKTVASTGLTERMLKSLHVLYEKVLLSPSSHASYYPGASLMTIKLMYDKRTKAIAGAQIIGEEGVDKRIDVLSTAMRAGITAPALKDLELAYAPPYSSAKDPVNMAGFIADNIEKGIVRQFYYEDLPRLASLSDVVLLDTRTRREYEAGHADGFINIPLDELRQRLGELDKNKKIYVMCQSGLRSYIATRILAQNGYDAYNFAGGYIVYKSMRDGFCNAKNAHPCGMEK